MSETETTETTPVDNFHRPAAILGHANGVVVRAVVDGENVDVLVADDARGRLLQALSHSLTDAEIKAFKDLLARQGH